MVKVTYSYTAPSSLVFASSYTVTVVALAEPRGGVTITHS